MCLSLPWFRVHIVILNDPGRLISGLLILAAFWHWAYWDLDVFFTSRLRLDLNKILSIHLTLASSLCLGFGFAHLSGFLGPGMWTSDSLNLLGHTRLAYGVITSHHLWIAWYFYRIMAYHIPASELPLQPIKHGKA